MTNIVILGGGFGGIRTALDLDWKLRRRRDVRIALIDKNIAQTFYPKLYELASVFNADHQHPYHTKLKETICVPYEKIFSGTRVNVVGAEVTGINLATKQIATASSRSYPFDYLIIALGAVPSTFGVPGANEYAFKFKFVEDGLMLADKLEELYRLAGNKIKPLPVRIIVGGGGFTGVELAAELTRCTVHIAHKYGVYQPNCTSITLIEAGPVIMGIIGAGERLIIQRRLNQLGITVMVNAPIAEVRSDQVKLKDGTVLPADIIVWSGGVKANDLLRKVEGLLLDNKDRVMVNGYLQTRNHPHIFSVGDANVLIDGRTQKAVPQLAYVAIEQGKVAAENISRLICLPAQAGVRGNGGKPILQKYEPSYSDWVAPVGGKYAVAHFNSGKTFSGFLGYLLREAIDLRYFLTVLPFWKAIELFLADIVLFSRND